MLKEDQSTFRLARRRIILDWIHRAGRALPSEYQMYMEFANEIISRLDGTNNPFLFSVVTIKKQEHIEAS